MRMRIMKLKIACALAADVIPKESKLSSIEEQHKRLVGRKFWEIGQGFEGSASDWTEYIVWLVGVIAVLTYMTNPNMRRNLHAAEGDEPTVVDSAIAEGRREERRNRKKRD